MYKETAIEWYLSWIAIILTNERHRDTYEETAMGWYKSWNETIKRSMVLFHWNQHIAMILLLSFVQKWLVWEFELKWDKGSLRFWFSIL